MQNRVEPLPQDVVAKLDDGVRGLVLALRRAGFETTDSGDGKHKTEMIESGHALPHPHVFIRVSMPHFLIEEAHRLDRFLGDICSEPWRVEASYSPGEVAVLIAMCMNEPKAKSSDEYDHL